jgi:Sugar-specific transcriptional regulator TrmB.
MVVNSTNFAKWANINVTGSQANVLLLLFEKEFSKALIVKELDMPRATLDTAFKGLIKKGLVKKTKTIGKSIFYTACLPEEVF